MTCSMLSASIAVAVPMKYIRNPGFRKAANEAGATGGVSAGAVAVDNQSPQEIKPMRRAPCRLRGTGNRRPSAASQPGAPRSHLRHGHPVTVTTAGGNQLH